MFVTIQWLTLFYKIYFLKFEKSAAEKHFFLGEDENSLPPSPTGNKGLRVTENVPDYLKLI